jgi:steroid delta-isomerase-like uncharacterized protein
VSSHSATPARSSCRRLNRLPPPSACSTRLCTTAHVVWIDGGTHRLRRALDDNKAIIRAFVETVWNGRQLDRADEVVAADFIDHAPLPGQAPGLEGVKRKWAMYLDAIPDFRVTIKDLMAEGDKVAVRRSYEGTHRGELLGIPAHWQAVAVWRHQYFRLAEGRIAEHWEQLDRLALMQQLGVVPAPGARPAGPATGVSRR